MAIANIKADRMILTLIYDVLANCENNVRQGCKEYRRLIIAGYPDEALQALRWAATRPSFVRSRVTHLMQNLVARLGSQGAANAYIDNALTGFGVSLTRAELNTELTRLEGLAQTAITGYLSQGWTLDQVAAHLETNFEDINDLLTVPHDPSYVQPWE